MADNIAITPGTGETVAFDDISSAKYQRIKLIHGADGVNAGDVSTSNGLPTQVVAALPAGTNGIGKLTANSGVDIGDVDVTSAVITGGAIADDATTPGNPVMMGGTAKNFDGTDPGSVSAEDDVTRLITDRNRRLYVNTAHPNFWKANENHSSAQTNNALASAPGANLRLYITDMILSNGATAGSIQIVEDTGGTPATILGPYNFGINSGFSKNFHTPIPVTINKDVGFTSTTVTTHTVTLVGFIAP